MTAPYAAAEPIPENGESGITRRLWGLLVAQFFGAFNDNAWKMIVATLATAAATATLDLENAADRVEFQTTSQRIMSIGQIVFTLPLFLFSFPAGVLSDRFSKRTVIIALKALEVVLMVGGAIAIVVDPSAGFAAFFVLALMAVQSALFSPAKYGIMPEILPHARLSWGNGLLEMWSMVAIISGAALGPLLTDAFGHASTASTIFAGLTLTVLAAIGLVASFAVPMVPPARSEGALRQTVMTAWQTICADRVLWLAIVGEIFVWTVATAIPPALQSYALTDLQMPYSWSGLPMAAIGAGIGIGCVLAGRLSASKVEYGLLPMGALGLTLVTLAFVLTAPGRLGTGILMTMLGAFTGLLLVPLHALVQWRSPADRRGAVIALGNVFVFGGMLAGSGFAYLLAKFELDPLATLLFSSLALAGGTIWSLYLVPDAFLRFLLILLANTFYRVHVLGRKHVPQSGGALLVPNHVSFVDGLFVIASVDRAVRFLVDAGYFERPILGIFLRALRAIPISASGGPRMILRAFRDAGRFLDEGHLVCIFPEGQISRTGTLLAFRRGFQRVVRGRAAPVIPVYLDRAFGSVFAPARLRVIPERIPYPITVAYGQPLPAEMPTFAVRQAVHQVGYEAWMHRNCQAQPLHRAFVRRVRRHPLRLTFADKDRPRVRGLAALARAIALSRVLRGHWIDESRVGILLPPSVPAALVNMAAALAGRAAVNVNYTAGPAAIASAVRQAGLRTMVTSRRFLDRAKIDLPEHISAVWVEEVEQRIGWKERILAGLLACVAPTRVLERLAGAARRSRADDPVTVIFSSGSTGEPKGVVLSHFNLETNIEAIAQVFRVLPSDRIVAVLPFFHAFGYLLFWFAANKGLAAIFHTNLLDAGVVGELIQRYRATVLVTTPTVLQLYRRRCTPAQFGSLRLVLAGAEKLPDHIAQAFEDEFGIRPLEGYGATECAPVIAVSTLDYRAPGFFQPGSRRGFVGQPLPGVAVRIVDPDTFETLGANTPGLLLVRGPNVMCGYLGRDDLTRQAMHDGWYNTGDIALLDEDGFLRITDRLARFSKIGGEMVPHGVVEEALRRAADVDQQALAVTAIADVNRGEQLVVVHTLPDDRLARTFEAVQSLGLPNLYLPRRDRFIRVDAIPMLGIGKVDLRAVKRLAEQRFLAAQ